MSRRVLLISSSRLHGQGYMAYCSRELAEFWGGQRDLLFIPFAVQDQAGYADRVRAGLAPQGFSLTSIHETADYAQAVKQARGIFIGGGNTFLLTKLLHESGLIPLIRARVLSGELAYMGSSAGSNVACPTMKTTNDMPIVQPPSFDALGLVPFQINAHYLDPDPNSLHMGETREERIREFHGLNSAPVVGLREGGLLQIEGDQATLKGSMGVRLFQQGQTPQEFAPGADLSFLLRI